MGTVPPFEDTIEWWTKWELDRLTRFFYDESMQGTAVGAMRQAEIKILKTAPHDLDALHRMIDERGNKRKHLEGLTELQLSDAEIGMLQWIVATLRDVEARKTGR